MNQPENNSNKSVTTNSLAVVLGKQSVGDFPLIQKAGDIPTNTNLIVLDCSAFDLPARILKDIRKVHPDSYLIAWLSVSDDDLFRALAGAGADDVAIGMAQLVFRLKVAERILAF
ncbi:hypothetical protein KAI87_10205, partial [Myxococcota bacterium]|nr:hypothetical protein [Myxococcota bacterium]